MRVTAPTEIPVPERVPPLEGVKAVPAGVPARDQFAETVPGAVGAKLKMISQLLPAARLVPQLVP